MKFTQIESLVRPLFIVTCVLTLSVVASDETQTPNRKEAGKAPKTVRIEFDYADGVQKIFPAVPWKPKMTLGQAMDFATNHKRGIKTKIRGKGAIALLVRIDDLQNQGAKGPNWVFRVNGKLGDRSFAITPLKPGDTVLWKFDTYP